MKTRNILALSGLMSLTLLSCTKIDQVEHSTNSRPNVEANADETALNDALRSLRQGAMVAAQACCNGSCSGLYEKIAASTACDDARRLSACLAGMTSCVSQDTVNEIPVGTSAEKIEPILLQAVRCCRGQCDGMYQEVPLPTACGDARQNILCLSGVSNECPMKGRGVF
jgi:hypothetical protein